MLIAARIPRRLITVRSSMSVNPDSRDLMVRLVCLCPSPGIDIARVLELKEPLESRERRSDDASEKNRPPTGTTHASDRHEMEVIQVARQLCAEKFQALRPG